MNPFQHPTRTVARLSALLLVVISAGLNALAVADSPGPIAVSIATTAEGYQLRRGATPYFVKGAGGDASKEVLVECGGNSFRTWGVDTNTRAQLDEAHRLGLSVTLGIWLGHTEHGFDYDDADAVARQFAEARQAVQQYQDHPAVLMWALGNEMERNNGSSQLWPAIEKLAAMVHEIDPLHPTMTVVAELGNDNVSQIHRQCPSIDVIGINSYGGGESLGKRYRQAGGTKPYLITEFGPPGTWETELNAFAAAPEFTSTRKADFYQRVYQSSVLGEPRLCLGSYVFAWGSKIEATATWFGMFLPDGSRLAAVDTMQQLWSGRPPEHPCPQISDLKLTSKDQVERGQAVTAEVVLAPSGPSPGQQLDIQWRLFREQKSYAVAGTGAVPTASYDDAIAENGRARVTVVMPGSAGTYRLYCTVRNQHGGAAVGSLPIRVKG